MTEDTEQWSGQELGDLAAYTAASALVEGIDARVFTMLDMERYGRWSPILRELFNAWQAGGHAGVFRRYLELVYSIPSFALLMATLGMQSPARQWQPEELPRRGQETAGALSALPKPPAAAAPRKLPKNWSLVDMLAGYYDHEPAPRRAVREEQVYAALRELGEATVAELARHTGQDRGNVHRRVQKLLEQNMIERHVTPKAIVYRVRA